MNTAATIPVPPSVPPPANTGRPFSVAAHRAFNDALEKRQRSAHNPELALRRARAELDAAIEMIVSSKSRGLR
jgi:hypothetical protein